MKVQPQENNGKKTGKKRSPLRVESENQLVLQLFEMSQRSATPLSVTDALELMQVDGKQRILDRLYALGG